MNPFRIISKMSYIVAFIATIFGFILFFSNTGEFIKSLGAAFLLGALVWMSYIIVDWLILAIRK